MNKTFKRALTLLLALCLTLPLASVIPVQAETENTATLTVEYPFYNPVLNAAAGSFAEMQTNGVIKSELTGSYPQSTNNVLYAYYTSGSAKPRMANNYVQNNTTTYAFQGLIYWCYAGDWIAFKIKAPNSGSFQISLSYWRDASSAKECSVYILPSTTATTDISNSLNSNTLLGTANLLSGSKIKTVTLGTKDFTEIDECLIVFKSTQNSSGTTDSQKAGRMNLIGLTMTSTDSYDISTALTKATTQFHTVKLQTSSTVDGALEVQNNATLDLNGKSLTASGVTVFGTGNVIDSSTNADGILKLASDKLSLQTNKQLPLYDSTNGGYRFYTATLESLDPTAAENDETAKKYWFRLKFSSDSAYDLIISGNSGLEVGANLSWTGSEGEYAHPDANSNFYSGWAGAAKSSETVAINLTVKGVTLVDSFTFTPTIKSTTTGVTMQ